MVNENGFDVNGDIKAKMEGIFRTTCGSWENCNKASIQQFLSECEEESIDPQFCFNWVAENSSRIPNWSNISDSAREWVIEHTSSAVDSDFQK